MHGAWRQGGTRRGASIQTFAAGIHPDPRPSRPSPPPCPPRHAGDKAGGIQTFALTYGAKKVAGGAAAVLLLNYVGAIATALLAAPGTFRRPLMAGGHALAAAWLWRSHRRLDAAAAGRKGWPQHDGHNMRPAWAWA